MLQEFCCQELKQPSFDNLAHVCPTFVNVKQVRLTPKQFALGEQPLPKMLRLTQLPWETSPSFQSPVCGSELSKRERGAMSDTASSAAAMSLQRYGCITSKISHHRLGNKLKRRRLCCPWFKGSRAAQVTPQDHTAGDQTAGSHR